MMELNEVWAKTGEKLESKAGQEVKKPEAMSMEAVDEDEEDQPDFHIALSEKDKKRLDQIFNGESGGISLDLDKIASEENSPDRWDTGDEIDGYVYWVIKLYKARRADNEDFWLKNVEGHLRPGEVCCILSPDNASTQFINLMSGRCPPGDFYGEIRVGGVSKTAPLMKSGTSYLLDSQVLADFVTVQENLLYTTYFVQPQSKSIEARQEMVENLMKLLGIEKLRDKRITGICGKGISCAERVLVNLGNMLLDGKRIIFLDCPTKELDLMETEAITVKILDLAKAERLTVFLSMENPTKALLDNFTKLLILANGQQLYFGTTQKVADFLQRIGFPLPEQTSIYDHVLQIIHDGGDVDEEDALSFRESRAQQQDNISGDNSKDKVREERQENLQRVLALAKLAYEQNQKVGMSPEEAKDFTREVARMRLKNDFLQMQGFQLTNYVTSWLFQIKTLIYRKLKKTYRDPSALFVQIVPLGIWVAIVSWWFQSVGKQTHSYVVDDVEGLSTLISDRQVMDVKSYDILVAIFISLFGVQFLSLNCVSDAIKEGKLYTSEARSYLYCKSAFVVSWVVICIMEQIILIIPYSICTFYFFGLYAGDNFMENNSSDIPFYLYYLMVHVMLATISELQINILAFATQQATATLQCAVAIQVITTLFAGIVVPFPDTEPFFQGLGFISPLKFAFEGIILEYMYESETFDDTGAVASILGTDEHPFIVNRYMAWIVLGSYLLILFVIFIAAASLRTYTSTK